MKCGIHHNIRLITVILVLDYLYLWTIFMHFSAVTQSQAFILKKNLCYGMSRCKIMTDLQVDFFKYLKENNLQKVPPTVKPLEPKLAQVKKGSCKFG